MFIKRGDDTKIITIVKSDNDVLDADVKEAMEKLKLQTAKEPVEEIKKNLENN